MLDYALADHISHFNINEKLYEINDYLINTLSLSHTFSRKK